MSTTKNRVVLFYSMADKMGARMRASRCKSLDCTFEAVEGVILTVHYHLERFIVVVATSFAYWHSWPSRMRIGLKLQPATTAAGSTTRPSISCLCNSNLPRTYPRVRFVLLAD